MYAAFAEETSCFAQQEKHLAMRQQSQNSSADISRIGKAACNVIPIQKLFLCLCRGPKRFSECETEWKDASQYDQGRKKSIECDTKTKRNIEIVKKNHSLRGTAGKTRVAIALKDRTLSRRSSYTGQKRPQKAKIAENSIEVAFQARDEPQNCDIGYKDSEVAHCRKHVSQELRRKLKP